MRPKDDQGGKVDRHGLVRAHEEGKTRRGAECVCGELTCGSHGFEPAWATKRRAPLRMRGLGCFVCSMAGGFRIASRSVAFLGVVRALTMCGRGFCEGAFLHALETANGHKQNRAPFSEERDAVFCCVAQLGCAVKKISVNLPTRFVAIAVYLPAAGACWPCVAGAC